MSEDKNRENYQRSFNKLHLSDDFRERLDERLEEDRKGKIMFKSVHGISKIAAAIAISVITLGSAGICYASDLGGIRTKMEMWLNGSKQTVEIEEEGDGAYRLIDENGQERGFGGMMIDENGNSTAMSAEELAEHMNNECFLETGEDGRVTFIYKNLKVDVTDDIDENGNLHVHIDDPNNAFTYFDISEYNDQGYHSSADKKPTKGVTYKELGSVDAGDDISYEQDENVGFSTTTTITED